MGQTSNGFSTSTSYHVNRHAEPLNDSHNGESLTSRLLGKMESEIDDEKEESQWPTFRSCLLAVTGFIIFAIAGCLVIGFPTKGARIALPIIALIVNVGIVLLVARDIPKKTSMRRNVANTVLLIFLTIILMTFLYEFVWYNGRTSCVVKFTIERPTTQRFPGIVVLEDPNYPGQAQITLSQAPPPNPLCIVGGAKTGEPPCDTLSSDVIANITQGRNGGTCDCSSYWYPTIQANFNGNTSFNYMTFTPSQEMVSAEPKTFMNLVVYFNYNSNGTLFNPSLWILVFDPSKKPEAAYPQAGSDFTLVDANSQIIVELSPRAIKNNAHASTSSVNDTLNFDSSISTIHNRLQTCDLAGDWTAPCQAHISVRFATFDQQVTSIEDEKSFGDTIESVGAFYALAQLIAWVFSGVAWVH